MTIKGTRNQRKAKRKHWRKRGFTRKKTYSVYTQSTDSSFVHYRGEFATRLTAETQANYFKALGYAEAWVEEHTYDDHLR